MQKAIAVSFGLKNLVIGRRRELPGAHRQPAMACCPSVLRNLPYTWNTLIVKFHLCLDYSVQAAGPMYIVLAFSLISAVFYLFLTSVLPAIHDLSSWQGIGHLLIAGWLALNVFFNYIYCIYTDPGSPAPVPDSAPDLIPGVRYDMGSEVSSTRATRWCKRCCKPKPPMTHHCHICKRCILKMDHHCPWMHNCIGFHNYRFFFVFLFYLWAGCLYSTIMSSVPLFRPEDDEDDGNNGVLFAFVLSLAVFISLSFLLGWHIYLVLTAQTTIDFYGNRRRRREAQRIGEAWSNEYDLGKLQNLRNVFDVGGQHWWLWILLPTKALPKGDGMHFPVQESAARPTSSSQPRLPMYNGTCLSSNTEGVGSSSSAPDRGSNSRERTSNEGPWVPANMV